jgi:2-phospho-L-lactate guanylyltransferase
VRTAVIPIRDFSGMTRLAGVLNLSERSTLARTLSEIAVTAAADAGLAVQVLTGAKDVAAWSAGQGVPVVFDAGQGLSTSLSAVVATLDQPWLVCHADLPLVTGKALASVASAADDRGWAIAPSLDGGTNVIAGTGRFRFSFGPGSFHSHLASVPNAAVIVDARLAVEVDTPWHLGVLRGLGLVPSLVS